jgi:diguanylate cyclase (GGDEF)-like protein
MRRDGRPPSQNGDGATAQSTAVRVEDTRQSPKAAIERDQLAHERDALAAARDREAAAQDEEANAIDAVEERADKHTLRVEELRARAAQTRRRAALDRERARADRERAAVDRELAARDRELAAHERASAGTDELTGTRRRGVGLEEVGREVAQAHRMGRGLVAVYADVDGLKTTNDGLGHAAGDEVLREVAAALRHHMRSYDLVVRLGGDEFLCVLPDVTIENARARLDAVNCDLEEAPVQSSISVGYGELEEGDTSDDLMNRADRDLLRARPNRRGPRAPRAPSGRDA